MCDDVLNELPMPRGSQLPQYFTTNLYSFVFIGENEDRVGT